MRFFSKSRYAKPTQTVSSSLSLYAPRGSATRTYKPTQTNMKYKVEITETLQRIVEVESEDAESAVKAARQMYRNEDIVLDEGDYKGVDYVVIN